MVVAGRKQGKRLIKEYRMKTILEAKNATKIIKNTVLLSHVDLKVFEGEIKDNEGNTVCKEGEVISDADITGNMNWYFETVEVK